MAKDSLNPKQAAFVREYLIDSNATQAAIRAGYSQKTAYSIGNENLKKPEIVKAIEEGRQKLADKVQVTKEEIAHRLDRIANKAERQDRLAEASKTNVELAKLLGYTVEKSEVTVTKVIVERREV